MTSDLTHTLNAALVAGALALSAMPGSGQANSKSDVSFDALQIEGLNIAYREAGDLANPTVLLLHGFPTSAHMFRELIPVLAEQYHVIAPDYPGFGASDMPDAAEYEYSFAYTAKLMTAFTSRTSMIWSSTCWTRAISPSKNVVMRSQAKC